MARHGIEQYPPIPPADFPPPGSATDQNFHYSNGGIPPGYQIPPEDVHSGNWGPWRPPPHAPDNEILGVRLMNILGQALTRASHSVLRFDLRGPILLKGPVWGAKPRESQFVTTPGSHGNTRDTDWEDPQRKTSHRQMPSSKRVQGVQGVGARIKFMQIWDFPNEETAAPSLPWGMNFGLGASMEIYRDGGHFIPKARLQTKYAVLHILPTPCLELRTKVPLGWTSFVVDFKYRLFLTDQENFWESPGHLMVNTYSQLGTGLHIIPGALDFDEQVKLGKYTAIRMAASVQFPSRIPLQEGDEIFNINVRRLEVKTRPI